jgi:uncharacterized protein
MSIVSNASPLINMARIGRLDLLHTLYGELLIPESVWYEVVEQGTGQPGADQVKTSDWIRVKAVENRRLVQALQQDLDAGESEAIVLALETNAHLLPMDERVGRETAHHLGQRSIGLIGILIEAKHKNFIQGIRPHLDALRNIAGFRVAEGLYRRVLQDQGEI